MRKNSYLKTMKVGQWNNPVVIALIVFKLLAKGAPREEIFESSNARFQFPKNWPELFTDEEIRRMCSFGFYEKYERPVWKLFVENIENFLSRKLTIEEVDTSLQMRLRHPKFSGLLPFLYEEFFEIHTEISRRLGRGISDEDFLIFLTDCNSIAIERLGTILKASNVPQSDKSRFSVILKQEQEKKKKEESR